MNTQKIYLIGGAYFEITTKNNLHTEKEIQHSIYQQEKCGPLKDPIRFLKELGYTVREINPDQISGNPQITSINLK